MNENNKPKEDSAEALWMQSMERNLNNVHETVQAMSGLLKQLHAVVIEQAQAARTKAAAGE